MSVLLRNSEAGEIKIKIPIGDGFANFDRIETGAALYTLDFHAGQLCLCTPFRLS